MLVQGGKKVIVREGGTDASKKFKVTPMTGSVEMLIVAMMNRCFTVLLFCRPTAMSC